MFIISLDIKSKKFKRGKLIFISENFLIIITVRIRIFTFSSVIKKIISKLSSNYSPNSLVTLKIIKMRKMVKKASTFVYRLRFTLSSKLDVKRFFSMNIKIYDLTHSIIFENFSI